MGGGDTGGQGHPLLPLHPTSPHPAPVPSNRGQGTQGWGQGLHPLQGLLQPALEAQWPLTDPRSESSSYPRHLGMLALGVNQLVGSSSKQKIDFCLFLNTKGGKKIIAQPH